MKRPRTEQRREGFSLVEVLCALLVLGIGVVGITEGLALSLRSSKEAESQTAASLLAASRIEFLRADKILIAGEEDGAFEAPFSHYVWRQTVTETQIRGLYDVRVEVFLPPAKQTLGELQTLLFERPTDALYTPSATERRRDRERGRESERYQSQYGGGS